MTETISRSFGNHMLNHPLHCIAVVGVFIAAAKNSIHNQPPPVHLQGLKSPGAPFVYGGCVQSFDMRTMSIPYGSPEMR
jgi:hypothetical protein